MYAVPAALIVPSFVGDTGITASIQDGGANGSQSATDLNFSEVASERGLVYESVRKQAGMRGKISRSGAFVADYDRDLDSDALLLGGNRPMLFENDGGRFSRSKALPSLNESAQYRTALFVDYDNDGWRDLVIFPLFGEPLLLHNDHGSFSPRPEAFRTRINVPVSATAADYDGDGCADVFVAQNGDWKTTYPARVMPNRTADNGQRNYLFRGTCDSDFQRVDVGIDGEHWSLSTSFVDFTGDGRPDIHVANDFHHDLLYVNRGDGSFEPREIPKTNRNGMASEVADVDGDTDPDIFVSNIYWTRQIREKLDTIGVITEGSIGNNLLINDGEGNFTDRAVEYDVRNGRWGWAASMTDLDNDGDLDLFHTTREQFVPEELEAKWGEQFEYYQHSRIFERVERGRFEDRTATAVGMVKTDGRGVGQLDFDADGHADLIAANADGTTRLYRNQAPNGNALQVTVRPDDNRTVLGTTVTVVTENRTNYRRLNAKADFLSQDSHVLHVGIGDADRIERLRVEYPDGTVVRFHDLCPNRRLVVRGDRIVERRMLGTNATRTATC
ncbi:CRTAC1 family protein [Halopelagius longus]|nr:CRTAC1 family protein [Halopelagius longus]